MLGQVKLESKTNEIKAIPALLNLLDITECILNHETSTKRSLNQKTKRAAMSTDYMLKVLAATVIE